MPVCFVIFGVTGDLARNKLIPALFHLYQKNLLPKKFKIIGYSRRDISKADFQKHVADIIQKNDSKFLKQFIYIQGQFNQKRDFKKLGQVLSHIDGAEFKECSHKLFYLAVPPQHYGTIAERLSESGLTIPCGGREGWTRILLEKPFGHDTISARKLNLKLNKLFKEEQIFRIDHYLAKETSQEILSYRFKKKKFEKFWNDKYIKTMEIKLLEKKGVGDRGDFYDSLGALRDVGQNHLLQMLALATMNRPTKLDSKNIRLERTRLLEKIAPMGKRELPKLVKRGQYAGFRQEEGVRPDSKTETYFRLNLRLATKRWRGTDFILESGKCLSANEVGLKVYFRNGQQIFFDYKRRPNSKSLEAYEKVIYDCARGDQTIFNSTREIEAAWKFITPILKNWGKVPLIVY